MNTPMPIETTVFRALIQNGYNDRAEWWTLELEADCDIIESIGEHSSVDHVAVNIMRYTTAENGLCIATDITKESLAEYRKEYCNDTPSSDVMAWVWQKSPSEYEDMVQAAIDAQNAEDDAQRDHEATETTFL